jgi:hypothetical protein
LAGSGPPHPTMIAQAIKSTADFRVVAEFHLKSFTRERVIRSFPN